MKRQMHRDCGLWIPDCRFPRRPTPGPQSQGSSGFTLVELTVSIAITGVLMLGVGSAMLVASRAMPDAASPAAATVSAGQALEQVMTELQYAASVANRSATMIEFTVADRDGNDVPEAIRYEWSGSAGGPLTRQYNGGALVEVLSNVQDFALDYDLTTISTEDPQGNESAETILKSFSSSYHLTELPIKSSQWHGQYFFPSLPADAVSWKVTRVVLRARVEDYWTYPPEESRVQLQLPTAGKMPSGVVLEEKRLLETSLLWEFTNPEFTFSSVAGLSPARGLCIVVKWIYGSVPCALRAYDEGASTAGSFLVTSTDSGVSWAAPAGDSLRYTVYGTVTTAGEPQIQTTYYLDRVNIRLRAGNDARGAVQTAVRTLNSPEVIQ